MRRFLTWRTLVVAAALLGGVGAGGASDFSALGREFQPPPSGHVPGKDNGPGVGTHNAGEDCGICHRPDGKAPVVFTASGTVYEDRAGKRPLKGAEIILEDIGGKVISVTSNAVGNFWTYTSMGSNPHAIASHAGKTDYLYSTDAQGIFHPANPKDARTWQYKAWVKNGDYYTSMVTIAPVGGATDGSSRTSCSMHHAPMGTRGALWAGGKRTLASYPSTSISFRKHVSPILSSKCVPCHIPGETLTRPVTRTDVEGSPLTQIDFSKSLDVTSYDGSSVTVNGKTWTKRGVKDVSAGYQASPDASPLLARPMQGGAAAHPGGVFWSASDADYKVLRQWIAEGAANN